jgi:molecular chaperone GrpE
MTTEFENNPKPGDNMSTESETRDAQEIKADASVEGKHHQKSNEAYDASPESSTADSSTSDAADTESGGELEEMQKKYLYLLSEFENFKRRSARERMELFKNASKDLLVELLPVLDDFERGLAAMEQAKEVSAVRTGVDLVYQKFRGILHSRGLQPIVAVGAAFDTELHEAISQAPAADDASKNTVLVEVEKGYKLNEQVVRYAKVIVAV